MTNFKPIEDQEDYSLEFTGPSRVKSDMQDDANINSIMRKWSQGIVPDVTLNRGVYGDFSTGDDYYQALNKVNHAKELFESLPAFVRKECNNDPAQLIALVADPANDELLAKLGLRRPIEPGTAEPAKMTEKPGENPTEDPVS